MYDAVIIGGGIAGLTAATWLARYRRKILIITAGRSRNFRSRHLHGYPGFDAANPDLLLRKAQEEAASYGAETIEAWVESVRFDGDEFVVNAHGTEYVAKRLVIATGVVDEKPKIPEFEQYEGISIWHCPACDGYEYTSKKIVVLGWGAHIAGYAKEFLDYTDNIVLVTHGHEPGISRAENQQLENSGIKLYVNKVKHLTGNDGQIQSVILDDGRAIACDGLFYSIDHQPRNELLHQLGCAMRQDGSVKVSRKHETSVRGVYAIGDIAPLEELAVVAAATGAIAASNIHKSFHQ